MPGSVSEVPQSVLFSQETSEELKAFHVFGCIAQIREDQCRHLNLGKNGQPCSSLSRKMGDK